jgi:hypothetical protein
MKSTLVIPKKCKVGFNERTDTYSGLLGYVIYHDGKTWRKEQSWQSWKTIYTGSPNYLDDAKKEFLKEMEYNNKYKWNDKIDESMFNSYILTNHKQSNNSKVEPIEFDNIPLEGFVINKNGGGGSGWDHRNEFCRVYGPRGFEIEISFKNLLYILEHSNCLAGKGLEGNFVYSWDGKDLVLLPENSREYKESIIFSKNLQTKVKPSDYVEGMIYMTKNGEKVTYLGKYDKIDELNNITKNQHWFHNDKLWKKHSVLSNVIHLNNDMDSDFKKKNR